MSCDNSHRPKMSQSGRFGNSALRSQMVGALLFRGEAFLSGGDRVSVSLHLWRIRSDQFLAGFRGPMVRLIGP